MKPSSNVSKSMIVPSRWKITYTEATDNIFMEIMGFNFGDLRMRYIGCRTIRFKHKHQWPDVCWILLTWEKSSKLAWNRLHQLQDQLNKNKVRQGLETFGELLMQIREELHEDLDSEHDKIWNGTCSVKLKLLKTFPQFLPMHGPRIRIYHSGINKLCTNFNRRHTRQQCRSQKTPWMEYVRNFMFSNKGIWEDYYGKWWDIVDTEYPGYFDEKLDNQRDEERQTKAPKTRFAEIQHQPQQSLAKQRPTDQHGNYTKINPQTSMPHEMKSNSWNSELWQTERNDTPTCNRPNTHRCKKIILITNRNKHGLNNKWTI